MEKWKDEKLFCLVDKKNKEIKDIVCINLLSNPCYIKKIIIVKINNKIENCFKFIKRTNHTLKLKKKKEKKNPIDRKSVV